MSENKLNTKTVQNEKTKAQDEELAALKKQKEEASKKAQAAKIEKKASAKEIEQETAKQEKKTNIKVDEKTAVTAGAVATTALVGLFSRKGGRFFKGLVIGLIIGILGTYVLGMQVLKGNLFSKVGEGKDYVDKLLSDRLFGYTAADFTDTILGEATEHQELIVMEQPLEVETTITKAGLGNFAIFSKTKDVTFAGTGVYTVDLSQIDKDRITVDEDEMLVTIYINHVVLQYVNMDLANCKFEDTERGALSFGDIALTLEQQNELEKSVYEEMKDTLESEEIMKKANEFALLKTWQTFQPLIVSMDPFYTVDVQFVS